MIAGGRPSAACHGECQERDTENEHFAHVCRHTGSNAIRQLVYKMVPAGDTGQKTSTFPGGSVCGNTELPKQEAQNVRIFLDDLADGATAGVAGLGVV